jgi:hypothetical protein
MIHFLYLIGIALFIAIGFGALADGTSKERIIYAVKVFAQFILISLALAWLFYFIPW